MKTEAEAGTCQLGLDSPGRDSTRWRGRETSRVGSNGGGGMVVNRQRKGGTIVGQGKNDLGRRREKTTSRASLSAYHESKQGKQGRPLRALVLYANELSSVKYDWE